MLTHQNSLYLIETIEKYRVFIQNTCNLPSEKYIENYNSIFIIEYINNYPIFKIINLDDTYLIDYYKKYDTIIPKFGYFLYTILCNTTNQNSYLQGGAVRDIFESFNNSKNIVDLDYFITYEDIKPFYELIDSIIKEEQNAFNLYMKTLDFKIFIIYYYIFRDSNLKIISINMYHQEGMKHPTITIKYNIKGIELKIDLNNNLFDGFCNTSNLYSVNCDFDVNGLQLYLNKLIKFEINMFRTHDKVPRSIWKYLETLTLPVIRAIINDINFLLNINCLNIIASFIDKDYLYFLFIIYHITNKKTYVSHVLCTNNYKCKNKYITNKTQILYKDKSKCNIITHEDKIISCKRCSTILYKPIFRDEKIRLKGYTIIKINCEKLLCSHYLVFQSNYIFLNMHYLIRTHKEQYYSVKFETFLDNICHIYDINKYIFIHENYRLYLKYTNYPNSKMYEITYNSGVAATINTKNNNRYKNKIANSIYSYMNENINNICQKKDRSKKKDLYQITNYNMTQLLNNI
uniref:Poly A polymerase head domain-containing protein n=1 Tax=viral metagenome TaxID=1070528 RepID=A0A6C0H7K5_9ZZZZ